MSVEEIFECEKRTEDNLYDIHFYMEGSFWRAYEWSAYLSRMFPSELADDERLRVIKKLPKGYDDGYVLVGLQLSSFDKYFPNVINNDKVFEMLDRHLVIHSKEFFTGKDFTDYEKILSDWKSEINASPKEKKNNKKNNINTEKDYDINTLINDIISYPIESKNLIECVLFLSSLKEVANKITKTT